MNTKKIGVLGGIGPESTGEFYTGLIKELQARRLVSCNEDFPHIIINSIPAPELILGNIFQKDIDFYRNGLEELDKMRPDFIVMVCNTIHLYLDELQKDIHAPILNIKDEIRRVLAKDNVKSLLVLGTTETVKKGLYNFDGIKCITPSEHEIYDIAVSIFNFNKGIRQKESVEKIRSIYLRYLSSNIDKVLLGCTELALMLKNENIPKINTIDVMIDATINRFVSLKYTDTKR